MMQPLTQAPDRNKGGRPKLDTVQMRYWVPRELDEYVRDRGGNRYLRRLIERDMERELERGCALALRGM